MKTENSAFEELEVLLVRHGICIAVKEKLVKDSGVAEEAAYDSIVLKLLTKPRAKGNVFLFIFLCYSSPEDVIKICITPLLRSASKQEM
ncbi:hypothetical protein J437_LFUL002842 [Ladona fulva]|uniref:Uncharacterized protein n=1 Tax=Ladona fulva TaxID=123851 RepID=A0A8K0K2U4_LADFU|nr:hypothetical protein J437_LFUL002842 [Ladona fulva]